MKTADSLKPFIVSYLNASLERSFSAGRYSRARAEVGVEIRIAR